MKFISIILLMVTTNLFAANIPVTIHATADNNFIIVLTSGQTSTKVYTSNNSGWRVPQRTTLSISNSRRNNCSIDFITWNDKATRGLLATVTGDAGSLHSGQAAVKSFRTPITYSPYRSASAIFPSTSQINQVISSKILSQTGSYGDGLIWGFDPIAKWIVPHGVTPHNTFAVHSFPCSSVVKGIIGRPTPIPAPFPRPTPPSFTIPLPNIKGDHFSCYMLDKTTAMKPEQITITDQFGRAKAVLGRPIILCNPSEKIHRGKEFKILNKKRHLVCYEILEQTPNKPYDLEIQNQFEKRKVRSLDRELFCVPSLKTHL